MTLVFGFGYLAHRQEVFPHGLIEKAIEGYHMVVETVSPELPWYYRETDRSEATMAYQPEKIEVGLTLVTAIGKDKSQSVKVIDTLGKTVHEWQTNWFDVWPDATHIPEDLAPKSPPGTIIHGLLLMENGDIIFNYDKCGLVRMDVCGDVVWKLPMRVHHSLCLDDDGNIWTSNRIRREDPEDLQQGHRPGFAEYTIVKISPEGQVLDEISIVDLLIENKMQGQLYLSSLGQRHVSVSGDTLHVNDVEIFPHDMNPGVFESGDVMVSMRNTNSIAVFDLKERKLKKLITGPFVRQHDPDFIDGNTIELFDNNNIGRPDDGVYSRIVRIDVLEDESSVVFEGSEELPFFTEVMGKQQRLSNGNRLLIESTSGRALEIDSSNKPVWDFINLVEEGMIGIVSEATRLPTYLDEAHFRKLVSKCSNES